MNISKSQEEYINSIEAIYAYLFYEVRKKTRNEFVKTSLDRLKNLITKLLDISQHNPQKFDDLILTQEFKDLYNHSKDKDEARFQLSYNKEQYLTPFYKPIEKLINIHQTSIDYNNLEISSYASEILYHLLRHLSQVKNMHIFVDQLLNAIYKMSNYAINKNDPSMYLTAVNWYIDIVFMDSYDDKMLFNIQYLDNFDEYFIRSIKNIINREISPLYEALISYLITGFYRLHYPDYQIMSFEKSLLETNYDSFNKLDKYYNLHKRMIDLEIGYSSIINKENLKKWLDDFEDYASIYEKIYRDLDIDNFQNIKSVIINNAYYKYKYNNLMVIAFLIGPYCIFKNRYDYIKYLWEYNQPPDSDATWASDHIIPKTPTELIDMYFNKMSRDKYELFKEDRHGITKYIKQYFILLLMQYLRFSFEWINQPSGLANFNLNDYDSYTLSDISHQADELKQTAQSLKLQNKLFEELNFEINEAHKLLDEDINHFLDNLKKMAIEKIENYKVNFSASPKKIEEVKKKTIEEFYQNASIRILLDRYDCIENNCTIPYVGILGRRGINGVYDKEAFFDEWYVNYSLGGYRFGLDLAAIENNYLRKILSGSCENLDYKKIVDVLEQFDELDNVVIIALNIFSRRFFDDDINFQPNWKLEPNDIIDIGTFEGFYKFKEHKIPVFRIFDNIKLKSVAIINLKKSLILKQYSPLNIDDDNCLQKAIFYMSVKAFSEDKKLLDEFLENPQPWLSEKGDREEQRKYLLKKVLIQFYERLDLVKLPTFQGYIMNTEIDEDIVL